MDERQKAILLEYNRRREIQRSMVAWSRHCGFEPEPHHRLFIEKIEKAARTGEARLIVAVPPGAAKSTYLVRLGVPWLLAQRPNTGVLGCSYSKDLIVGHARSARNYVELHSNILGFGLRSDTRAADEWETTNGGRFFCAGTNAGIAGHRANIAFIDDPIGSDEDAKSQNYRDKQWSWYWDDFIPRLQPGGSVIIIANRRHEDDLCGRLLAVEGEKWDHVKIPLVIDTPEQAQKDLLGRKIGERLWPSYYTDLKLQEARRSQNFSGLYQQDPSPEEGDLIKKDDLIEYHSMNELPKNLHYYVGSDHALTEKEENDSHALVPAGLDEAGDLWILPDVWWEQGDTLRLAKEMLAMNKRHELAQWWAEDEHIRKAIGPFLRVMMHEQRNYIPITANVSSKNLVARSSSIRGMMRAKKVHFPSFWKKWHLAKHQMLSFPKGKHDDFIAGLSQLGIGLASMNKPQPPKRDPFRADAPAFIPTLGWLKESHRRRHRNPVRFCGR